MKKRLLSSILITISVVITIGCKGSNSEEIVTSPVKNEAEEAITSLWNTSALNLTPQRKQWLDKIGTYAETCPASYFKTYLNSLDATAESQEKYDNTLYIYRKALDKVLDELKKEVVANGTTTIWTLYNMGVVVKTPSKCFGIDLNHRWAEKLEPYLDFMLITHNHADHYDEKLINAMVANHKPVYSNYLTNNPNTSVTPQEIREGNVVIQTAITDHNTTLRNFVTVYRINCGSDANNFSILHCGDSNYNVLQYAQIQGDVDLLIPRYAPNALTENNIIGVGENQVNPKYLFMSHILELSHDGVENSRWSIDLGLERASQMNCTNSYMPFWGEKFSYLNGVIT